MKPQNNGNKSESQATTLNQSQSSSNKEAKVRLPKIELPHFDGNPLNFQSFWDLFESTVDKNEHLSDVDKFSYLKNLLSSSAAATISGLTLTNGNYKEAVNLLKERYGNPQLLVSVYFEALVKLPRVTTMNNVKDLRMIYDKVESSVRNLRTLGIEPLSYGSLLTPLLTEKLPDDLKLIISRKFKNEIWNLEDLLKYFKEELHVKENCSTFSPGNLANQGTVHKGSETREKRLPVTASALFSQSNFHPVCVYCNQGHPSSQCSQITDIKARKAVLRQKARCFVCTKSGHIAKSCPSNYTCRKCSRKHHISLCESGKPQVRMLDGKSKASCSNQEQVPCVSTGTVGCHVNNHNNVLLQTGLAKISNVSQPGYILKSRLLFDCGSQRSFISTELRDKLNLPTIRKESVMVKTFGTEQSELKTLEVVQFCVHGKNDVFVEAFCTPVVCSPLTNQRNL